MLQRSARAIRNEIMESGMIGHPCYKKRGDNAEAATEMR